MTNCMQKDSYQAVHVGEVIGVGVVAVVLAMMSALGTATDGLGKSFIYNSYLAAGKDTFLGADDFQFSRMVQTTFICSRAHTTHISI